MSKKLVKIMSLMLAIVCIIATLSACGNNSDSDSTTDADNETLYECYIYDTEKYQYYDEEQEEYLTDKKVTVYPVKIVHYMPETYRFKPFLDVHKLQFSINTIDDSATYGFFSIDERVNTSTTVKGIADLEFVNKSEFTNCAYTLETYTSKTGVTYQYYKDTSSSQDITIVYADFGSDFCVARFSIETFEENTIILDCFDFATGYIDENEKIVFSDFIGGKVPNIKTEDTSADNSDADSKSTNANYTTDFSFSSSGTIKDNGLYAKTNFKKLSMDFLNGREREYIIGITNSVDGATFENSESKIGFETFEKTSGSDMFTTATYDTGSSLRVYDFVDGAIPISSVITVKPLSMEKDAENEAPHASERIAVNYQDSYIYITSANYSSIDFRYNDSITVKDQKGDLRIHLISGNVDENVFSFGGRKGIELRLTTNTVSDITVRYKNGSLEISSSNPDIQIKDFIWNLLRDDWTYWSNYYTEYAARDYIDKEVYTSQYYTISYTVSEQGAFTWEFKEEITK